MAQKVATAHKIKPRQTTTLMQKLKFRQGQAIFLQFNYRQRRDKTATRDIFKFRQATRDPPLAGPLYRPRRSPSRTREVHGCSWMFLKVYFLNFRYFFIAKKQQLVLYSYITYREIENNQPGSGAFARFLHPHPGEFAIFLKKC